jgi:hypothetical protein
MEVATGSTNCCSQQMLCVKKILISVHLLDEHMHITKSAAAAVYWFLHVVIPVDEISWWNAENPTVEVWSE